MLTVSDELRNLVGRYVRNVDLRDHPAQIDLLSDDAAVRVIARSNDADKLLFGPIVGGKAFAEASAKLRQAVQVSRRTRHCTVDHLIAIDDDVATIDAQFLVVHTDGLVSGRCSSEIVETGAYRFAFRRELHVWKICELDIIIDSPALEQISVPEKAETSK